ncbi:MAG: hypothetical protein HYW48_06460 [Deltaproteobacteria bacterium]|nr:hypothetical protein [Deltaproteobacteria bacterium]
MQALIFLVSFLFLAACQESKPQERKSRTGISDKPVATAMTEEGGSKVDDASGQGASAPGEEEDETADDGAPPKPKGKSCITLTPVENGKWPEGTTSADDGSSITGACNEGYDGNLTIACLDGTWGAVQNTCTERLCANLDQAKRNLTATFASQSAKIGDSLTGTCGAGFDGSPVAKCEPNGSWTITGGCTPTGQAPCTNLETSVELLHGIWPTDTDSADWGASIVGTCNEGFKPFPSQPTATCVNGTWRFTPGCESSCTNLDKTPPANGTWITAKDAVIPAGQYATGVCEKGYYGDFSVACRQGNWANRIAGGCTPDGQEQCSSSTLSSLANGVWERTSAHWFETQPIQGTCNAGFIGNPTASCTPNAALSAALWVSNGTCVQGCLKADLDSAYNLVYGSWKWPPGLSAQLLPDSAPTIVGECNPGATGTSDPPAAKCTDHGWEVSGDCGAICSGLSTPLDHGTWEKKSTGWGTTVTGTCISPWDGSPQIECKADGTWGNLVGDCNKSLNDFADGGVYTIKWAKATPARLMTLHYQFSTDLIGADKDWRKTQIYTSSGIAALAEGRQQWRLHYAYGEDKTNCYKIKSLKYETTDGTGWFLKAYSKDSGYWGLAVIQSAQIDASQTWCFTKDLITSNYQIVQKSSGSALSGYENHDYKAIIRTMPDSREDVMKWKAVDDWHLRHMVDYGTDKARYLDAYECTRTVTTRTYQSDLTQKWRFANEFGKGANDVDIWRWDEKTCGGLVQNDAVRIKHSHTGGDLLKTATWTEVGKWEYAQWDVIAKDDYVFMFRTGPTREVAEYLTAYFSDPWAVKVETKATNPGPTQLWIIEKYIPPSP